jgi:hypothetical protein
MDYIDKNLLKRLSNYEDVSLFAAFIMKIKYWGKILRSKDNTLSKELLVKNVLFDSITNFYRLNMQSQPHFCETNLKNTGLLRYRKILKEIIFVN